MLWPSDEPEQRPDAEGDEPARAVDRYPQRQEPSPPTPQRPGLGRQGPAGGFGYAPAPQSAAPFDPNYWGSPGLSPQRGGVNMTQPGYEFRSGSDQPFSGSPSPFYPPLGSSGPTQGYPPLGSGGPTQGYAPTAPGTVAPGYGYSQPPGYRFRPQEQKPSSTRRYSGNYPATPFAPVQPTPTAPDPGLDTAPYASPWLPPGYDSWWYQPGAVPPGAFSDSSGAGRSP
jgi:hypothetical protein